MSKGIDHVRKSIMHRRKLRQNSLQRKALNESLPSLPTEEEKHGYLPTFFDQNSTKTTNNTLFKGQFNRYLIKAIISAFIFIGAHFLLQTNSTTFDKPKSIATTALTEDFPFARVYIWYQHTFGAPLAFTPNKTSELEQASANGQANAMPVNGTVTEPFDQNGKGVYIAPNETTTVSAWKDGVVIFAGNDRETNKTIIIQHEDKSKSVYGSLSSMDVHLYQFVPAHQPIGTMTPTAENESVYFSLQKNNEYMDPFQVIQVDDLP